MEILAELFISMLTLTTVWLTGDKNKFAPVMGLIAETGWFVWIVTYHHWGLLLLNIVLFVLYARMYIKWRV